MSANSPTEICNLALAWVAANSITSLDDDASVEAIQCRANYDSSRRSCLEEREWTFAQKRRIFNPLVDKPVYDFTYMFRLPADCLKVNKVQDPLGQDVHHLVEDHHILSNKKVLHVRYTYDLDNTRLFSNLFVEALAASIASKIAMPLTHNVGLSEKLEGRYERYLQKAVSTDALQGSRERLKKSRQELSRRHHIGFD